MPIIAARLVELPGRLLAGLKTSNVSKAQAVTGASQPRKAAGAGVTGRAEKMRRLSPADGRRGCQARN